MARTKCAHTNFRTGQPVFVILKSGEKFEDKFRESRSKHVEFVDRGKVQRKLIRQCLIRR